MNLDDILGIATLVCCVAAILWARRGARKKLSEAYAQGARDVSSRASAGVHVGDIVVNRSSGRVAIDGRGSAGIHDDDYRGDDDDDDRDDHDDNIAASITMRRTGDGDRLGDLRNLGVGAAIGELPGGGAVANHPAAGRAPRVVRIARTRVAQLEERVVTDDNR